MNTTAKVANKRPGLHARLGCGWLSSTKPVSLLANEFNVRSILHWQVRLAAVNPICVIHKAMNGCNNGSEDSLKTCYENINIQ